MNETAVADTGPLLHLAEIQQDALFTNFRKIVISSAIEAELVRYQVMGRLRSILPDQLHVIPVEVPPPAFCPQEINEFRHQPADVSVIRLACLIQPQLVLTDDLLLRRYLESKNYKVVGSIGILIRSFHLQQISKNDLYFYLDRLFDDSSLYFSRGFYAYVRTLLEHL